MESNLVQWVLCDNELKEMASEHNEKIKIVKEKKENLGKQILNEIDIDNKDKKDLPTFNIPSMGTSISPQSINSYESYTNKFYKECFTKYFDSEEKADELISFMKSSRKIVKKSVLKRDMLISMED